MTSGPFAFLADDEREAWERLTTAPRLAGHAARSVTNQVHGLWAIAAELAAAAPTYTDETSDWTPVERCAFCHADVTRYGMARGFHALDCLYRRAVTLAGTDDPPPTLETPP